MCKYKEGLRFCKRWPVGNGPTKGQRKTLTRVGICSLPSVVLTLTWFIWGRYSALHITLQSFKSEHWHSFVRNTSIRWRSVTRDWQRLHTLLGWKVQRRDGGADFTIRTDLVDQLEWPSSITDRIMKVRIHCHVDDTVPLKMIGAFAYGDTSSLPTLFTAKLTWVDENHNQGKDESNRMPQPI